MEEVRLILMCGLPGAGKTMLAEQLAVERPALIFEAPDVDELALFDRPPNGR